MLQNNVLGLGISKLGPQTVIIIYQISYSSHLNLTWMGPYLAISVVKSDCQQAHILARILSPLLFKVKYQVKG